MKFEYTIFEGFDHFSGKNLFRVQGVDNEYIGEWHDNSDDAQKELEKMSS